MLSYCVESITGIHLIYVPSKEIEDEEVTLADRQASATTVPNTRQHHCFISTGTNKIRIQCISCSNKHTVVSISKDVPSKITENETKKNGNYVACACDSIWWLGVIKKHSEEHMDFKVQFLHPSGPGTSFYLPSND
jgi:hypothetical protein